MSPKQSPKLKSLVVYESFFGNTGQIAEAIAKELNTSGDAKLVRLAQVHPDFLKSINLLIVGAPTRGGRPSPAMYKFLDSIPSGSLQGVKIAAFDTRFAFQDKGFGLRLLMGVIKYAAEKIAQILKRKGGTEVIHPEGFIVVDTEGPLKEGELARATKWAAEIVGKQG